MRRIGISVVMSIVLPFSSTRHRHVHPGALPRVYYAGSREFPRGKGGRVSEAADIRGGSSLPWREIAAGHEAGHAVVAWHYGARIDLVTVIPFTMGDGTQAGGCVKAAGLRSRRAEAACDLGGYAANITLQDVPADMAWRAAGDDVRRLREAGIPHDARTAYIGAASDILTRRRRQWERLCTRLLTADSLSWREAADILGPPRSLRRQVDDDTQGPGGGWRALLWSSSSLPRRHGWRLRFQPEGSPDRLRKEVPQRRGPGAGSKIPQ